MLVASRKDDAEDDVLCNNSMTFSDWNEIDGDDVGKSWMKYERMVL